VSTIVFTQPKSGATLGAVYTISRLGAMLRILDLMYLTRELYIGHKVTMMVAMRITQCGKVT